MDFARSLRKKAEAVLVPDFVPTPAPQMNDAEAWFRRQIQGLSGEARGA